MARRKTKKQGPSKLFAEALKTIDLYLKGVTYGTFAQHRSNLKWAMPLSIVAPLVGVFAAWLWQNIIIGAMAPLILAAWFFVAILPWLYLMWLALALYSPLIILTIPSEYSEKLKELNASPENVKKIVTKFSDIIAWILFAGIYCFFFKVWHNILAVIPLVIVVLYFLFGTKGEWIVPDPKFKAKLFKAVLFLVFLPLTISFIRPTFYYHVFGRSPSELSNAFQKTDMALEKLQKTIQQKDDENLADALKTIERLTGDGKITTDSARVLAEKTKKHLSNNSLFGKASTAASTMFDGIKKIISSKGDTTIVVTHLVKPGQIIWEKTLTDPNNVFDTEIQLTVGSGVFIKNNGPGKVRIYWADFDADLEPNQRYAINFVKNRPGATIQFQLLTSDSTHVAVMS